jgi:hypothetical protein
MSTYERPHILTLDSSQIVEMMGPAQGYSGAGGSGGRESVVRLAPGGPEGFHPR